MTKYSEEFIKNDYTKGPYPTPHSVGDKKLPPDGDGQPRTTGPVLKADKDDIPIGLSYDRKGSKSGDFGPYIHYFGEGLPNSFDLSFKIKMPFSAGNVHSHTGLLLFALALNARPKIIVETGTYYGYSTMYLAKACEIWGDGKVYTIDCNDKFVEPEIYNHPNIEFVHNYSENAIPEIIKKEGEIQFAFIDSWKRIAYKEFMLMHPYIPEGGVVCFHDTQFLNTGRTLYDLMVKNHSAEYDLMLFTGKSHKDNPHKFFGNADDRGLFVARKKNKDPFFNVNDYNSAFYGDRQI